MVEACVKKKTAHRFPLVRRRSVRNLPTALIAGVLALSATANGYFLFKGKDAKPFTIPSYTVLRVIDGDTFETTEKQLIRLASIDAPEMGLCGSDEAKAALEKKILKEAVDLKVIYRDPYDRLISMVYTSHGYINEQMIKEGYARYYNRDKSIGPDLLAASTKAHEAKVGIFGPPCTQETNTKNPECTIKANNREDKLYFVPGCTTYKNVDIQLYMGDQWFCTEKEAQKAGFTKAKQCPET
jgi:micrococcal nuclease